MSKEDDDGPEPTILLEGRGIDKFFGKGRQRRQVLFGVDITVYAGECLAVIGGSGSGKTTLTRVLLGLERCRMPATYAIAVRFCAADREIVA